MYRDFIIADINSPHIDGKIMGHYVPVARMYSSIFESEGNVFVCGAEPYNSYFDDSHFMCLPYSVNGTKIKHRIQNLLNCRSLFKQARGKIVIMQQCRDVLSHLGIALFKKKDTKVYIIRYSNKSIDNKVKRFIFNLCKKKIDGLICPSDKLGKEYGVRYLAVPDYIYLGSNDDAEAVPFNEKKYDFCIVGRIAPGKGAVESAKKLAGTKYKVIIAGKPENERIENDLKTICHNAPNIDLRLGFVSTEDYERFHKESKYTILNYEGEYSVRSSGAVFDTIFAGVPVVGRRCESLQFVDDYGIGYIYDSIDDFDIESVMDENLYNSYLTNINKYRLTHEQYKKELVEFVCHS